jgi:3-dehydroquinate synthase
VFGDFDFTLAFVGASVMPREPRTIRVELGERSYPVVVGRDVREALPDYLSFLRPGAKIAVVTSERIAALCGESILGALQRARYDASFVFMPDGEQHKTLETASLLYDAFVEKRLERGSLALSLGGGTVGDVAGFVAATYLRGIPFAQMPTTLIAQVDASVGGKVAVDHPKGKNLIGAFYQPRFVLADIATLDSLPEREFRAGIPEVLRYGVIASQSLFALLEERMDAILSRDPDLLTDIVAESVRVKAEIVSADETESGVRANLNYGHTFAHAIEAVTGYGELLHGEAVAIGERCAAELARARGLVSETFCARQTAILESAGVLLNIPESARTDDIVDAMTRDKKVVGGSVRFVVPRDVGTVEIRHDFTRDEVKRAVEVTR